MNRYRYALGQIVAVVLFALGQTALVAADAPPASVQVTIDFGDGVELRFKSLPWRAEMTALEAIQLVSGHAHGVKVALRGSGSRAFVEQIGDLKNEGGGRNGRNWRYRVNGKPAEVGIGSLKLAKGDSVLWKFERYQYNSDSADESEK